MPEQTRDLEPAGASLRPPSVRLRLTGRGALFLVLSGAVAFTALFEGNNLLFALFCSLAGLLLSSALLIRRVARRLEIVRLLPGEGSAGEPFPATLEVRNPSGSLPAVEIRVDGRLSAGSRTATPPPPLLLPFVGPRRRVRAQTSGILHRRGWISLEAPEAEISFPPGLLAARRRFPTGDRMLVLPRRGQVPRQALAPELARLSAEEVPRPRALAGDDEFAGLREFRPGDNPRRIHWKLSSRLPGQLRVKEFSDDRGRQALLLLDSRIPPPDDTRRRARLERAVSFASALAEALLAERFHVRCRAFAPDPTEIRLDPRPGSVHPLRAALATLRPEPVRTVDLLLEGEGRPRDGEIVFLLSLDEEEPPPRGRTVVVTPSRMRTLMFYA